MKKLILIITSLLAGLAANAATVVNLSGSEQNLQDIVAGTSIDIATDQLANDSYFSAPSLSGMMVIEIAGHAPNNAFGIYEQGNTANKFEIFAGSAVANDVSGLIPLAWSSFGFYLTNLSANFTWYSDALLNDGGQFDHFVTYKGTANETMTASGITFGSNDYLIGIEDLNLGDYDYNDMVVKVHLTPVVEQHSSVPDSGATAALMGLGLCALVAIRRRK